MFSLAASAQEVKSFSVSSAQNIADAIPATDLYQYPDFKQGIVFFKNKAISEGILNYNYLLQELFFIDSGGDTLAISNPLEVDSVTIGTDRLYFSEVFIKLDTIAGKIKLGETSTFTPVDKKIIGPFGIISNSVGNINSVRQSLRSGSLDLEPGETITFSKEHAYFIGNRLNRFFSLNKKNLFTFFAKKESLLNKYLQQNHINFSNRADIIRLLIYMDGE